MASNDERVSEKGFSDDQLWTVQEAARFLQLSPGGLYHLVSQKRVPVIHISSRCVRFRRGDLEKWISSLSQSAEPNE